MWHLEKQDRWTHRTKAGCLTLHSYSDNRLRDAKSNLVVARGERGQGSGERESKQLKEIKRHTLPLIKQVTECDVQHREHSQQYCSYGMLTDGTETFWADHPVMHKNIKSQKLLQYCKVISLQLIKINEKKLNHYAAHLKLIYCIINSSSILKQ